MLIIETLNRKAKVTLSDGTKIVDLTAASIKYQEAPKIERTIMVSDDLAMRPDVVSRIVYGNANKLDYLLKFNDISNPFSLDEGQVLLVPNEEHMRQNFVDPRVSENTDDLRNKLLQPDKFSKKDQKRLEYLKEKAKGTAAPSTTNLPPNFADPGSEEIKVKDGKIVFGDDVVANLDNCPEPLSRASVKSKLLANKIFRNS